jgi:hypothetical protein
LISRRTFTQSSGKNDAHLLNAGTLAIADDEAETCPIVLA